MYEVKSAWTLIEKARQVVIKMLENLIAKECWTVAEIDVDLGWIFSTKLTLGGLFQRGKSHNIVQEFQQSLLLKTKNKDVDRE